MRDQANGGPAAALARLRVGTIESAARLEPYGLRTPLVPAHGLGHPKRPVYYKCENLQRTGSFKMRGALNKLLLLPAQLRARGVVVASTGNHGLAVAEALRLVGGAGAAVVSNGADGRKVDHLRAAGLRVIVHPGDALAAEIEARAIAEREDIAYVSPYNDLDVVAGQGTVGAELLSQLPNVEVVLVTVGGGGLASGIGAVLKAVHPGARLVACWPANAPAMYEAMRAGRVVDVRESPTISDATTGNIEANAVTIALCQAVVDECILVSESEIVDAMRDVAMHDHLVIEGAAAVAVAGYRRLIDQHRGYDSRVTAIVLCGGQVSSEVLARVLT
jgi:threonine dehydratase